MAFPQTGRATPVTSFSWPNGSYHFVVDQASFQSNLPGLTLTTAQIQYWIPYALMAWRERSGLQEGVEFNYGTVSPPPGTQNCDTTNHVFNSTNEVTASAFCKPNNPDCSVKGFTYIPTATHSEADVCIYGASETAWYVRINSTTGRDLVKTLRHEFGHAIGLSHDTEADSVMSDGDHLSAIRELSGNDIKGIRMLYPRSSTAVAHWREMTASTWSAATTVPAVDGVWGVSATVGRSGTGTGGKVIVTELSDDGGTIGFNRATFPISSSSSWDAVFSTAATWRPPAITARPPGDPDSELWVSALALAQDRNTADTVIRIYRSTNAFTSRSTTTLSPGNNPGELQLTYDPASKRFVLVMVGGIHGDVRVYTSSDAVSWPASVILPAPVALDGVDVACAAGTSSNCVMSYHSGDTDTPKVTNRKFSIASDGTITLGSMGQNTAIVDGFPAVASRTVSSAVQWMLSMPTASSPTNRTLGIKNILTTTGSSAPITSFSWSFVDLAGGTLDRHRPDLASVPAQNRIYLWYVQ